MPQGKRSLTDLKRTQFYRRVRNDPVSVLIDRNQQLDSKSSGSDPRVLSDPVNDAGTFLSLSCPKRLEVSDLSHSVLGKAQQVSYGPGVDENAPAEIAVSEQSCCVSCLTCRYMVCQLSCVCS